MILLLPGSVKHVYLACGCRKVEIDADDQGTFAKKCRDCKRWTEFTVCPSPSGRQIQVQREFAPVELATAPGVVSGGGRELAPAANRRNTNRGARP